MSGWQILIYGAICSWGALIFLRFTVAEIDATQRAIDAVDELQRKNLRKRQDTGSGGEAPDAQAVA
jgi:hypothetical protein